MIIGIDFSLNNPGLCIKHNNDYYFTAFYNNRGRDPDKKTLKTFKIHEELSKSNIINVITYNRKVSSKDFLTRERQKMIDAYQLAEKICNYIDSFNHNNNLLISLEGFSYGSKGNSFIDMVQYNSFLRYLLTERYTENKIFVFQPSHVKKNAGKGNCNKMYMINRFKENVFKDKLLQKNKYWNWIKNKEYPNKEYPKDPPKPIDDLCDSYFILKSLEFYLEK